MKLVLKIVLAGVILLVLIIGGCTALVGTAMNDVEKESQKNSITQKEFKSVKQGDSLDAVKERFGEPQDEQTTEVEGLTMDCIYYPVEGGDILESYQFCFDNGSLSSKSSY